MAGRGATATGIAQAIAAAVLFGVSTQFAKKWLTDIPPLQASGMIYLGSGLALGAFLLTSRHVRRTPRAESPLQAADLPILAASIAFGIAGAGLLLYGLGHASGSVAALLLNLETVFTVLFAVLWGESLGLLAIGGIAAIVLGSAVLGVSSSGAGTASLAGLAAIVAACACWGLDNNLTRSISAKDPVAIAATRGLVAGPVALALAAGFGSFSTDMAVWPIALVLGALGFGVSLALFIRALRSLGAARAGGLFATAPFVGAVSAIPILSEQPTWAVGAAGAAMALGVLLMSQDSHSHEHVHDELEHGHLHVTDEHHQHSHDGTEGPEPHAHRHRHERLAHAHPHVPDIHHRHKHDR